MADKKKKKESKSRRKKHLSDFIWLDKEDWESVKGVLYLSALKRKTGYNDWILKQMKLKKTDVFLEIGCGDGSYLVEAAKKCRYVVGADIAKQALDLTKKELKEAGIKIMRRRPKKEEDIPLHSAFVRWGTANNLAVFKDGMFDAVYMNLGGSVVRKDLYWRKKLLAIYLKEAARLVKENGCIYFTRDIGFDDEVKFQKQDWEMYIINPVNKKLEKEGLKLALEVKYVQNLNYLIELHAINIWREVLNHHILMFILQKTKL